MARRMDSATSGCCQDCGVAHVGDSEFRANHLTSVPDRAFLHRLGREANQGEVGIVVGDRYYGITKFDRE